MEKHKEVFFVIRLHSAQSAASLAVSVYLLTKTEYVNFKYDTYIFCYQIDKKKLQ